MLMSCPFCGTGTDLPHEKQEACIAALHSEISRVRRVVEHLNRPAFAEASAGQVPAFAEASAGQAPAFASASAKHAPAVAEARRRRTSASAGTSTSQGRANDFSGDSPNPQPSHKKRG
jgi:hypothetical protein